MYQIISPIKHTTHDTVFRIHKNTKQKHCQRQAYLFDYTKQHFFFTLLPPFKLKNAERTQSLKLFEIPTKEKEWKSHRKYWWTRWKAWEFRSHKMFHRSKTSTQQPWSPSVRSVSTFSTTRRRFPPPFFLVIPWLTSSRSVRTWPPGLRIWVLLETWASTRSVSLWIMSVSFLFLFFWM